jgi:hypothetical protein
MVAAPLSKQIEAPQKRVTLLSSTPHLLTLYLFSIGIYTHLAPCAVEEGTIRPPEGPLALCVLPPRPSQDSENGLPHAVLADGVYVRAAYCAHLACS